MEDILDHYVHRLTLIYKLHTAQFIRKVRRLVGSLLLVIVKREHAPPIISNSVIKLCLGVELF